VRGIALDNRCELREHAFEIRQNVIVPEAHYRESLTPKPLIARRVGGFARVLPAVHFDYDTLLEREKVCHVRSNRNLPPELGGGKASIAQQVPELALGVGHAMAQRSCSHNC